MEESIKVTDIEELSALYFDKYALIEPPIRMYRLNAGGNRYYYNYPHDNAEPEFYPSVTTIISQTLPKSKYLEKWGWDNFHSYEEKNAFVDERAYYGTFLHIQIADFLINKNYNLDELKGKLKQYIECEKLPFKFINYADELKKDMLSFAKFCIDTNLKPLAIEIVLAHPDNCYGGAIDLVCELDLEIKCFHGEVYKTGKRKGQPKQTVKRERVRAIGDFKSGRKGFYESHKIQLKAYQEMWNVNYPNIPVDYTFNWSPKEWRNEPSYNLEDQTNSKECEKLPHLIEIAKIQNRDINGKIVSCGGIIKMGELLTFNIQEYSIQEYVNKKKQDFEKPDISNEMTDSEIAGEKKSELDTNSNSNNPNNAVKTAKEISKNITEKIVSPKDLGI